MTEYYAHELVTPKLRPPTVEDELQIFGGAGGLAARVAAVGSANGFQAITVQPGDDVFDRLGYAKAGAKVLVILQPGTYREITYRMPGPWNWSSWLVDGDSIASHQVIAADGITVDGSAAADSKVTVWLSGGTAGAVYDVTVRIVTNGGREDDRTVKFSVVDR